MKLYLDFSDTKHNIWLYILLQLPNSRDHIPARKFLNKLILIIFMFYKFAHQEEDPHSKEVHS